MVIRVMVIRVVSVRGAVVRAEDAMDNLPAHIVLLFVDGLGWGGADPEVNPCLAYGGKLLRLPADSADPAESAAPTAAPVPSGPVRLVSGAWVRPIDAVLQVEGIPQSATGQTTLLSGINAQAQIGKHLTGFPNEPLRDILREHSLLRQAVQQGHTAAFLNAYRPRFFDLSSERQWLFSATTVANLAADLPFFRLEDITAGRSIYQEFTNSDLRRRGFDIPLISPEQAGRICARAACQYDLILFEYFQTDRAGHSQDMTRARAELTKLDGFLKSLLTELSAGGDGDPFDTLVVLTSDHGNLEDLSTKRHTTNPVPLLAWGPAAAQITTEVSCLDEVTPALLRLLSGRWL